MALNKNCAAVIVGLQMLGPHQRIAGSLD